MPEEPVDVVEDPEVQEEIDDTVPCPACHQPVRLSLLADKYAAEVPARLRPKASRGTKAED